MFSCFFTDGFGMICRTIGRTIMFSQMGFPNINRYPRPGSVPGFVRYQRHRLRFVPSATICATRLDLGHGVSSAPPAAIRAMGRDPYHEMASAPSAAIKQVGNFGGLS
jgi:hypothetical protein